MIGTIISIDISVFCLLSVAVVFCIICTCMCICAQEEETSPGNNITQPQNSSAPMTSIPVVPRSGSSITDNRLPRYTEIVLEDLPPTYDEIAPSKQEINETRQSDDPQNRLTSRNQTGDSSAELSWILPKGGLKV